MTGNSTDVDSIRYFRSLLLTADGDFSCCEVCGGHLPDHDWADLNPDGTVIDCSEQTR